MPDCWSLQTTSAFPSEVRARPGLCGIRLVSGLSWNTLSAAPSSFRELRGNFVLSERYCSNVELSTVEEGWAVLGRRPLGLGVALVGCGSGDRTGNEGEDEWQV